ncbi:MAG: hypothetical protein HY331_06555 [Chloroflexi bacterium]|nr:hypothetical protein [Chloroflexota bacterium]
MSTVPETRWKDILEIGGVHASGRTVVRVGAKHLLVGDGICRALQHLSAGNPPTTPEATVACLEDILPAAESLAVSQCLGQILAREPLRVTLWRDWLRGMLRFPLWQPPRWIAGHLQGRVLRPFALVGWGAVLLVALASLGIGSLPQLQLLPPAQWPLLWLLVTLTTAVHEAGHVLVAAHFGVSARAVGIALLYLQPAGYADVSDAWLAPRRARIAISLGGFLLQSVPLVACYALWRLTGASIWGVYCLLSVVQIALNLVPFVRLDGYWLICHLLDEPNLRQRAYRQLLHLMLPRKYAAVWRGQRGTLGTIFAVVSLAFTVGAYGSALAGLPGLLRLSIQVPTPLLVIGASAMACASVFREQMKE